MRLSVLCAVLPLLLTACGGGSDPAELRRAGSQALGQGDFATARESFDQALAEIGEDPAHPEYLRAKMGAIEARTKDAPDEAVAMFMALASKLPKDVGEGDGGRLGDAGNFNQAIEVAKAGKKVHANSAVLDKLIQDLGDKAKAAGKPDALDELRGLGYVGD
jgi:hypothetical protein